MESIVDKLKKYEDYVAIGGASEKQIANAEHTLNLLAVGDILLTTVCADERERFFAALANLHNFGDKLHIFNLFFRQFIGLNSVNSQINAS